MGREPRGDFDRIQKKVLPQRRPSGRKLALFLLGSPASGKTSVKREWLELLGLGADFVDISPDDIMAELPQYKAFVAAGDAGAAAKCHGRAYKITSDLIKTATARGEDILLERTGQDAYWTTKDMEQLVAQGYSIHICIVVADLAKTLEREPVRAVATGRHINAGTMADIHKKLQDSIGIYMGLPFLKSFTVYDNNADRPRVVEHVMRGGVRRGSTRRRTSRYSNRGGNRERLVE
jgi:predicted ABC-type ATPase